MHLSPAMRPVTTRMTLTRRERETRQKSTSRDGYILQFHYFLFSNTSLGSRPLCNASPRCPHFDIFCFCLPLFRREAPSTPTRCLDSQAVSFTHADRSLPTDVDLPRRR